MSDLSPRLSLPLIAPAQAQKHVTHNEALQRLDVLAQLTLEAVDQSTPPAAAQDGQVWALGASPSGVWSGQPDKLAAFMNGAWVFIAPVTGWQATDTSDASLKIWTGTAWEAPADGALENLDGVGINASYDAFNRLVVASGASLFNHEGAGHQIKINKATTPDTAGLLFQTGFSGRAEMGTAGSDSFSIKVSADSVTWNTGLAFNPATGQAQAPAGLQVSGQITGSAVTQSVADTTVGRLVKVGDYGLGSNTNPLMTNINATTLPFGQYRTAGPQTTGTFPTGQAWGHLIIFGTSQTDFVQLFANVLDDRLFMRRYRASAGGWQPWRTFWNTANTTVDVNGFIRAASPIVQLSDTGHEEPVQPVGAVFEKLGVGQYRLGNVEPLAHLGWSVEIPRDINGNRQVFVDLDYDAAARTLTLRTTLPVWEGSWKGGAPCDIPQGRWIDLRFAPVKDESGTAGPGDA
jgi:hypothetical protein